MNHAANEVVQQIAMAILKDPELSADWASVFVVFKVGEGTVGHIAEQTLSDGKAEWFLLDDFNEALDLAPRLQQLTRVDDRDPWVACKVSVVRATKAFGIDFEYQDRDRWDPPRKR